MSADSTLRGRIRPPWVAELPWVGPMVGWIRPAASPPAGDDMVEVSLVIRPSPMHACTTMLVLVPMLGRAGRWQPAPEADYRYWPDLDQQPVPLAALASTGEIHGRLMEGVVKLRVDPAQIDGRHTGLLILTLHDDLPLLPDGYRPIVEPDEQERLALAAVQSFLAKPTHRFDPLLLRLGSHVLDAFRPGPKPRRPALSFAVASCQYPHGLLDRHPAGASYRSLSERLDDPKAQGPQFLLLLGDQVYVDETAGVFNPSPAGGALDRTYDRAFRLPEFRAVTSRLPTFMLLDDHEVANDWQPPASPDSKEEKHLAGYAQRQAALNPRPRLPTTFSFSCAPGGWPLFVLDTRSRREARTPENFGTAKIVPDSVMRRLERWLEQQDADGPKFVGTASVLLPFERSAGEPRWSSDGWAGYPASRARLIDFIRTKRIRNVVFLAGDPHVSMVSKYSFRDAKGPPLVIYGVVSSGLYAPWRFSNADRSAFQLDGSCWLDRGASPRSPGQAPDGSVESVVEPHNGYAIVRVSGHDAEDLVLEVEFDSERGRRRITQPLTHPAPDWSIDPPLDDPTG